MHHRLALRAHRPFLGRLPRGFGCQPRQDAIFDRIAAMPPGASKAPGMKLAAVLAYSPYLVCGCGRGPVMLFSMRLRDGIGRRQAKAGFVQVRPRLHPHLGAEPVQPAGADFTDRMGKPAQPRRSFNQPRPDRPRMSRPTLAAGSPDRPPSTAHPTWMPDRTRLEGEP
jgi:hypothetical protein